MMALMALFGCEEPTQEVFVLQSGTYVSQRPALWGVEATVDAKTRRMVLVDGPEEQTFVLPNSEEKCVYGQRALGMVNAPVKIRGESHPAFDVIGICGSDGLTMLDGRLWVRKESLDPVDLGPVCATAKRLASYKAEHPSMAPYAFGTHFAADLDAELIAFARWQEMPDPTVALASTPCSVDDLQGLAYGPMIRQRPQTTPCARGIPVDGGCAVPERASEDGRFELASNGQYSDGWSVRTERGYLVFTSADRGVAKETLWFEADQPALPRRIETYEEDGRSAGQTDFVRGRPQSRSGSKERVWWLSNSPPLKVRVAEHTESGRHIRESVLTDGVRSEVMQWRTCGFGMERALASPLGSNPYCSW